MVAEDDRRRWDDLHARAAAASEPVPALPEVFAESAGAFPTRGRALDIACGRGLAAVWLAQRGLSVEGFDISPAAVGMARALAEANGVAHRCRFGVVDLDGGLPAGPPVDVVLCHMFRDPRLDRAIIQRLVPGGLVAVAALSEVGHGPGRYRVAAGELRRAFAGLSVIASGEQSGRAWLLARAPGGRG